ncbi:MAG TPA: hypothetical protein DHW82_08065 [Spirochaetia bacterium]|nr:MAG: hypothetical protein A2Y41_06695 [Spirochaetes bacterium GWB1_36_13]HCL56948.1 hypothetical protein [Spirochaetia bacterium]
MSLKQSYFFKKTIQFFLLLFLLFTFFSCGSKRLVFETKGEGYEGQNEKVVTYKDLRKLYDVKNYSELYKLLLPVIEMKGVNDFFIHFLLIESAFFSGHISDIEDYYLNSEYKYFYKGMLEFEKNSYIYAVKFLKQMKYQDTPVIAYFIGVSYFFLPLTQNDEVKKIISSELFPEQKTIHSDIFKETQGLAAGYLLLAKNWSEAPWPYLMLSTLYEEKKEYGKALEFVEKALENTYDFENNILTDILLKKTEILLKKESYSEALSSSLLLYQRNKEKTLMISDPGDIYLLAGEKDNAIKFWSDVLKDNTISEPTRKLIQDKLSILEKVEQ